MPIYSLHQALNVLRTTPSLAMSAISSTFRQPESFRTFARVGSIIAMLGETKKPANTNVGGLKKLALSFQPSYHLTPPHHELWGTTLLIRVSDLYPRQA